MSATPNLLLAHIAASQNQKEVTANNDFDGLDEALCSNTDIAMTDADYTFATGAGTPFLSNIFFKFSGTITSSRNVILPAGSARLFVVVSEVASSPLVPLVFKVGTGAQAVDISDSNPHLLYSDGVNTVWQIS